MRRRPVLVVDDDPLVGAEICRALRRSGLEAWAVEDASRMVAAAIQIDAGAVVVDEIVDELVDAPAVAAALDVPVVLLRFEIESHPSAVVIGGPRWLDDLVEYLAPEAALSA